MNKLGEKYIQSVTEKFRSLPKEYRSIGESEIIESALRCGSENAIYDLEKSVYPSISDDLYTIARAVVMERRVDYFNKGLPIR